MEQPTERVPVRIGGDGAAGAGDTVGLGDATAETSAGGPDPGGATTVMTPRQALEIDELRRTKMFTIFVMGIAAAVVPSVLLMDGDPLAIRLMLGGGAVAFVVSAWVRWRIRDLSSHRPVYTLVFGYACVFAVTMGFVYFGPLSAVVMVVPIGAYFFALGARAKVALAIVIGIGVTHFAIAGAMTVGLIEDRGYIVLREPTTLRWVATIILIQGIFAAAYAMARTMRRSTLDAIEQLEHAVRGMAQREALFQEAKQDLERALRIGGPGRYTDQVVGSYRLGSLIGRGATGEVYEATHTSTDELAAVKLLSATAVTNPQHVARFLREIRVAASLRSPHIVGVREVADDEAAVPYLAMERLRGQTLSDVLRQRRVLPPEEVVALVEALCHGVAAAHDAGIVHRDLKPQNVFAHREGDGPTVWKILDFGASKLMESSGTFTQGGVIGTPAYMAPEQARGDDVDHRVDLYAIGAVAYRAITGRPAFIGGDTASILYKVIYTMPRRPSAIADLAAGVDAVLAVAMAKDRSDRFARAEALATAFAAAAQGRAPEELVARAARVTAKNPWSER